MIDSMVPAIRFRVAGHPRTKGSMKVITPRGKKPIMIEEVTHSKPWRTRIRSEIFAQCPDTRGTIPKVTAVYAGPVEVRVTFLYERKVTEKTGAVWPSHDQPWPISPDLGDLDKLTRNLLDAMQDAGVIVNDSQVVALRCCKAWGVEAGLQCVVFPADGETALTAWHESLL